MGHRETKNGNNIKISYEEVAAEIPDFVQDAMTKPTYPRGAFTKYSFKVKKTIRQRDLILSKLVEEGKLKTGKFSHDGHLMRFYWKNLLYKSSV